MNRFLMISAYSLLMLSVSVNTSSAQAGQIVDDITSVLNTETPPVTLKLALQAAQSDNPRILIARQQYEISKTDIRLARSTKKPVIDATASYGYLDQDNSFTTAPNSSLSGETSNIGINLRQPLFRGFQGRNAISRTKSTSSAAEFQILAMEQQVFLEVATAYLDVQRDKALLKLNLENLETLKTQLNANEKRYELKDTSLTDVARTKSAVASGHTSIATARANYAASRSIFFRLTGLPAENLISLQSTPELPASVDDFFIQALQNNASISAARSALEASEYAVKEAKGARLPSVDFNSSLTRSERPENFGLFSDNRTTNSIDAGISVRVPLYQADQEFGNVRRAKQLHRLREIELTQTMGGVRDMTRITWDRYIASKAAFPAYNEAVETADIAAEGTRRVYRSGLISAIDLLDTEQILLSAKINQQNAKHDLLVTAYTALSIIGDISP